MLAREVASPSSVVAGDVDRTLALDVANHLAFWNRLGMSGLFAHHPGYGMDGMMVWASEQNLAAVELSPEERARYEGRYEVEESDGDVFEAARIWENDGHLHIGIGRSGAKTDNRFHLVPFGDDRFVLGRYSESGLQAVDPHYELRFVVSEGVASALEIRKSEQLLGSAKRID